MRVWPFGKRTNPLFDGAPGPSPWYLRDRHAPKPPGFHWQEAGDSKPCTGKMMLVGARGPVAILGFYNWTMRLPEGRLLVWNQPFVESGRRTNPVRLVVFDPSALVPLEGHMADICALMESDASIRLGGSPIAELELETASVEECRSVEFPDPVRRLDEILILCHSSAVDATRSSEHQNLVLLVAHPSASSYRMFPQDWYNHGGFDYGYEWVTRVVRDKGTGRVHGQGMRIPEFVLDEGLRTRA